MSKFCVAATLLIFALTVTAQESKQQVAASQSDKPAAAQDAQGLSFTIRFKDGKSQFRPGEIIRVELSFASSQPHVYRLDAATYDRSGRLEIDDYHLSPKDAAVDPLYDYYHNGLFGFMGGGGRATPELESKPYLITAELNEWFRFDKPGKYRLYVTTNRISKVTKDGRMFGGDPVPATSNTVEFEILPEDAAWSKQKLQEAIATLDANKNSEGHRAACRDLRFMNTLAAAKEMVRRFKGADSECEFEYYIGLIGTPHRTQVMTEMEKMLGATDFPITGSFISVLSYLRYITDYPELPPPYPQGDKEREKLWQAEMQKQRDVHEKIVKSYLAQLAQYAPTKQKDAKAISLSTILDYKGAFTDDMEANKPDEQLAAALANVFLELPADNQYRVLAFRWKQIASAEILPILRRMYEKPMPSNLDLRDIVLKRIYELAPDEGRQLILKEIESGHPRVRARVLGILPDEILPELDDTFAAQMEKINSDQPHDDIETYSALVARYATPAIFPRIKAAYADKIGRWACAIQTPLLAYFLRVDTSFGIEMLEKALASRDKEKDSRCYTSQLLELKGAYWNPEIEKVALAHLTDPHPEVMISAAHVVSQYGAASDEQPLWNALEQWHTRYSGHEDAVRAEMKKDDVYVDPAMIEIELVRALASGNSWMMNAEKLNRLQLLCSEKQCKDEAASFIKQAEGRNINLYFNFTDGRLETISLAQYNPVSIPALKEKLAQFPKGTTFTFSSLHGDEKSVGQLFEDLQAYLKEKGMKLERAVSEK